MKELRFVDIKIGMENIKEDFLKKIDKYYDDFSQVETAMVNIRKSKIDATVYLLMGLDETAEDVRKKHSPLTAAQSRLLKGRVKKVVRKQRRVAKKGRK